jgi:hypothetical protein
VGAAFKADGPLRVLGHVVPHTPHQLRRGSQTSDRSSDLRSRSGTYERARQAIHPAIVIS